MKERWCNRTKLSSVMRKSLDKVLNNQKIAVLHNIRNKEMCKYHKKTVKSQKELPLVRRTWESEEREEGWANNDFFVSRHLVLIDLLKYFNKNIILTTLRGWKMGLTSLKWKKKKKRVSWELEKYAYLKLKNVLIKLIFNSLYQI